MSALISTLAATLTLAASGPIEATSPPALAMTNTASTPSIASRVEAPTSPVKLPQHFVFANHYGLTMGLEEIPSGDISLFFGRAMSALSPARAHRRWALGYQLTLSVGGADRYVHSGFTHRHHLMAVSYGTLRPRLYAAVGGGLAVFGGFIVPAAPRTWRPSIAEVEGRLGYIFGRRRHSRRLVGVVGGTARVGWNAASLEKAPVPQLGAFIGFLVR